jgi:tetratricopeptide (TPR) repeat protein
MKDHNTLDIYRLKAMTGNLATADDVMLYAQLALQMKSAAEAKAAIEKGIANQTLPANDRTNRLLKLATDRANANAANFDKAVAAAQNQPGDALVALGEDQIGQGKAKEAIATIQAGIAKNPKDMAEAQLRLGTAYLAAGQKADAIKAFSAVKGDDKAVMVAHLYTLAARSDAGAQKAEAAPAKSAKPARKRR